MVVIFWLIVSLQVVWGVLQCYHGDSLLSTSRSVTFPDLQKVNCGRRGFCQVITERKNERFYASTARCVDRCSGISLGSVEQVCCQTDFCNFLGKSQIILPSLAIDKTSIVSLVVASSFLLYPTNRVGVSGYSKERDICVTVVLVDPPMPGGLFVEEGGKIRTTTMFAKGVYASLKKGSTNCVWNREHVGGNADVILASGVWSNIVKFPSFENSYLKMNLTVTSEIFTGQVRFDVTKFMSPSLSPATVAPSPFAAKLEKVLSNISISLLRRAALSNQNRFVVNSTARASSTGAGLVAKATVAQQTLTVQISSPAGIGDASITKTRGAWPRKEVLLLNLRGLESFQVSNGLMTLHASISSSDSSVQLWNNNAELEPVPELSRMLITVVNETLEEVAPPYRFPLAAGLQFQIILPSVLFAPKITALQLQWIDFYR